MNHGGFIFGAAFLFVMGLGEALNVLVSPKEGVPALGLWSVIALVCVLLGARAGFDALYGPYDRRWFGFGVSYDNPVEEAEFVKTHLSLARLGNDYTSGGYLLCALWSETRVMIDPRQFPFKKWIGRYGAFHSDSSVEEFLREFPCEVWCIRYECRPLIRWFSRSPDWRTVYYGPSAVVFAKKGLPGTEGKPQAGPGIGKIRNIDQAILVLGFPAAIHDWDDARAVLAGMREHFRRPAYEAKVQGASASGWSEPSKTTMGGPGGSRAFREVMCGLRAAGSPSLRNRDPTFGPFPRSTDGGKGF